MQTINLGKQMLAKAFGGAAFALTSLALLTNAHGETLYSTDFDSFTTETLSGQPVGVSPNWDTNDAYNNQSTSTNKYIGQSDYVGFLTGFSSGGSDKWGALGGLQHNVNGGGKTGVVPGAPTVYLYNRFALGAGTTNYAFDVDFAIPQSTQAAGAPTNDRFAWTFQSGSANLFSIDFVPNGPTVNSGNGTVNFGMRYSVAGVQTLTGNGIVSNSAYHLKINVNVTNNNFTITLAPLAGGTSFTSNAISLGAADPLSIVDVAATWTLTDTSGADNGGYVNAGSNALIFNNYVITVPEPSTWSMIGLAAISLGAFVYRRRMLA